MIDTDAGRLSAHVERWSELTDAEFLQVARFNVEALNRALEALGLLISSTTFEGYGLQLFLGG